MASDSCSLIRRMVILVFASILLPIPIKGQQQCSYTIVTVTGKEPGAATDACISVRLANNDGKLVTFPLRNGANDFERGQADVFFVTGDCVPNICKVVLYTDDKGYFPSWFVDSIKVNGHTFRIHSWLPRDDGLGNLFIVHNECPEVTGIPSQYSSLNP